MIATFSTYIAVPSGMSIGNPSLRNLMLSHTQTGTKGPSRREGTFAFNFGIPYPKGWCSTQSCAIRSHVNFGGFTLLSAITGRFFAYFGTSAQPMRRQAPIFHGIRQKLSGKALRIFGCEQAVVNVRTAICRARKRVIQISLKTIWAIAQ